MSLSSLIVQREIATIREVEEALARQVLYGGDLVTNLLEVSRVDEAALVPVVAESFGLPAAPPGELPTPSEEAKQMVAAEVAGARNIAPLSVDRYGLVVAVAEPLAKEIEQELTFTLALPVSQKIAPLVRIKEALARDYRIALEKRMDRLLARMRGDMSAMGSIPPPPITATGLGAAPRPPSAAPPPPPEPKKSERPPRQAGMPHSLVRTSEVPPPRAPRRRRGPLTADIARVELEDADDRDTILDLVFEFARQYFDYTALFLLHGDVAEGRDAYGGGASREKVVRVGVPLDLPGMLAEARTTKKDVRRVPSDAGVDPILLADLGRPRRGECIAIPIVVRTRVVAFVFGDGGEAGLDEASLEAVHAIVGAAAAAFERLIVRRKLKGTRPPGKPESSMPPAGDEAPRTEMSAQRPAVEELAPPIRDLLVEPPSKLQTETQREPVAQVAYVPPPSSPRAQTRAGTSEPPLARSIGDRPLSERPPPPGLLAVRRPSGRPIPREDPVSEREAPPPARAESQKPPVSQKPPASRTRSGSLRRAEAPPLEFGAKPAPSSMSSFAQDDVERSLLAQIHGVAEPIPATTASPVRESLPPPTEEDPPHSPKAVSPPPPPMRATSSRTEVSPGNLPMFPAKTDDAPLVTDDTAAPAAPVALEALVEDEAKTPAAPPPAFDDAPPLELTPPPEVLDVDASDVEVQALPPSLVPSPPADTTRAPMPISEQQVSVGAHRPPSARTDASRVLPSVIVDVASEYVSLVERALAGHDEEAEAELIRAGGYAMPAIMARFPGPITVEDERLASGPLPRVQECGTVLRLVASQRRTALPFVLAHVEDEDETKRFWATYLLTELVYPDTITPATNRCFDESTRVRRAARAAVRAIAEHHGAAIAERLDAVAKDASAPRSKRLHAIEALRESREPTAVPALVALLKDADVDVVSAARQALVTIARQDFGSDAEKWREWWTKNESRDRIEWLIDALMHDQASMRAAAGEELKTLTKEQFGYYEDLPRRERAAAQQRYRDWWEKTGRLRFARSARG